MRQIAISEDLLRRIGQVIDDVVAFEECNCGGDECQGDCLHHTASEIQDEILGLLKGETLDESEPN